MNKETFFKTILDGTVNKVPEVPVFISTLVENSFIKVLSSLFKSEDEISIWFICNWLTNDDEATLIAKHLAAVSYLVQDLSEDEAIVAADKHLTWMKSIIKNRLDYISKYCETYKVNTLDSIARIRPKENAPEQVKRLTPKAACLRAALRRKFGMNTDMYLEEQERICKELYGFAYYVYLPMCYSCEALNEIKALVELNREELLLYVDNEYILSYLADTAQYKMPISTAIETLKFRGKHIHKLFMLKHRYCSDLPIMLEQLSNMENRKEYIKLLDTCYQEALTRGMNPIVFIEKDYSYEQLSILLRALKKNVLVDVLLDNRLKPSYMNTLLTVLAMRDSQGYQ